MKYLFTLLVITTLSSNLYAQSVNDYKYVIVPEKYDFLKSPDQYQVNSLTKFLFNKYGFEAYLERDEKSYNKLTDPCKILYANVTGNATFIRTTLEVTLKDCNDQVIFKTSEGRSKKKDYKEAYHAALREAFYDIEALQYNYNPSAEVEERKTNKTPEPSMVKDKSRDLEEKKQIVSKTSSIPAAIIFTSEDGFYKAKQTGTTITFYDDSKKIGIAEMGNGEAFDVTTTDFSGTAFFLEGRLVVQRKIKGIAGVVEMIFTKE